MLLRWPGDEDTRGRLASVGTPRLLLVAPSAPLPTPTDDLEDWIRLPADELDLHARIEALEQRAARRRPAAPDVDDDGVLRRGSAWVSLPPVEARIARALVAGFGQVVSRAALSAAAWSTDDVGRNALDAQVLRLRRHIEPLGLGIRTVRARGFALEASAVAPTRN